VANVTVLTGAEGPIPAGNHVAVNIAVLFPAADPGG
jgi:hypothetical protein